MQVEVASSLMVYHFVFIWYNIVSSLVGVRQWGPEPQLFSYIFPHFKILYLFINKMEIRKPKQISHAFHLWINVPRPCFSQEVLFILYLALCLSFLCFYYNLFNDLITYFNLSFIPYHIILRFKKATFSSGTSLSHHT